MEKRRCGMPELRREVWRLYGWVKGKVLAEGQAVKAEEAVRAVSEKSL
jgi:hypothetical protein